jgi:hypothetical protein
MIQRFHKAGSEAAVSRFVKEAIGIHDLLMHLPSMAAGPVAGAAVQRYLPGVSKALSRFGTGALDTLEAGPRAVAGALKRAPSLGAPSAPSTGLSTPSALPKEPTFLR